MAPAVLALGTLTFGATNSANASVLLADLNQISFSVPAFITSVGTVKATDETGGVDVLVTLNNGALFVNTGGPHTPFVYNLDIATMATNVTPAPTMSTTGFTAATGSQSETPYGTFSNGINYSGSNGGVGRHGNAGPLEFFLAGITTADFVENGVNGYFFGADVLACSGIAGVTCTTGGVAANSVTLTVGVPSPRRGP